MTVPWIDTLYGSSAAYSRRAARLSAEPALQPDQELARMQEWPLRSYLELRALPASVRSARLHAKNILHGWRMDGPCRHSRTACLRDHHQRGTRISP